MSANVKAGLLAALLGLPVLLLAAMWFPCPLSNWAIMFGIGFLAGLLAIIFGKRSGELSRILDCLPAFIVPALGVWLVMIAAGVFTYVFFPEVVQETTELVEEYAGQDHATREMLDLVLTPRFLIFFVLVQNACCCGLVHVLLVLLGTLVGAMLGFNLTSGSVVSVDAPDPGDDQTPPAAGTQSQEQESEKSGGQEVLPPVGPPSEAPTFPSWLKDE